LKRTDYCGRIDRSYLDQTVTLMGWVHRRRDHGGVIFVDLRDREGLVQIVFNPDRVPRSRCGVAAQRIRDSRRRPRAPASRGRRQSEPALRRDRGVCRRGGSPNTAITPPFQLDDENLSETVRLQHRVIDLRRPSMQKNMMLRHRAAVAARRFLDATASSTSRRRPLQVHARRRARVPRALAHPSRLFYALPQIAATVQADADDRRLRPLLPDRQCFRDEDLRADRQPEFTQIDIETSFLDELELRELMEELVRVMFSETIGVSLPNPFPVMAYADAMRDYGPTSPTCACRSS
jgi:aspartyl-tRNA synthetase